MFRRRFQLFMLAVPLLGLLPSAVLADQGDGLGPPQVTIVSSLPISQYHESVWVANGIRMALADNGPRVEGIRIDYLPLDDSPIGGSFSAEIANANRAASDKSVVAYIGPFNSSAAKHSIPILCRAGLGMVAPTNTHDGLTKPIPIEEDPSGYYAGCTRNYSRVIPRDSVAGEIAAVKAGALGARRAYVVSSSPGDAMAYGFSTYAPSLGIAIAGSSLISNSAQMYPDVAAAVAGSGADTVYFSCFLYQAQCGVALNNIRTAAPAVRIVTTDEVLGPGYVASAGPAAEGVILVRQELAPPDYSPTAAAWYARYTARYGAIPYAEFNGAIYGYEATNVVLRAIATARRHHAERAAVRQAIMATSNFNGLLGSWSFDGTGDITPATVSTAVFHDGAWVPTGALSIG